MDNNQNEFYTPEPPKEIPKGQAIKSLVFGILSIYLGFMPIFSIVGIIFSRVAAKNAKAFLSTYPETPARGLANAGRITGNIGLPVSIVMTVFWAIYIVAIVALVALGMMEVFEGSLELLL